MPNRTLPPYAAELAAFHEAFGRELRDAVDGLPIRSHMRVLDVGCGDGFYTKLLAERLGPHGSVIGLDENRGYLELARGRFLGERLMCHVEFIQGTLEQGPIEGESCDFAWCAQSLFSLRDPVMALRQMRAALRPGGLIALLENDTLHQVLLPWPGHLEVAVKKAELAALEHESPRSEKYYVGRRLPEVLAAAGFEPLSFSTQSIDRHAPCDENLLDFLQHFLSRLSDRVRPFLDQTALRDLRDLINPQSSDCLFMKPFFTLSWFNMLACGRKG
jgi:ubiquinone/menaquinone biosynthesis C-methylase UbiE